MTARIASVGYAHCYKSQLYTVRLYMCYANVYSTFRLDFITACAEVDWGKRNGNVSKATKPGVAIEPTRSHGRSPPHVSCLLPVWQIVPVYPETQVQLKPSTIFVQVPPF